MLGDGTRDRQTRNRVVIVKINRQRAAMLGVTPLAIMRAMANAYSEQQASTVYTPTNEYWVVLQLRPEDQQDINALSRLYITSGSGKLVPLSDIATFMPGVGPQSIAHSGQLASVTISFNLPPNGNLGAATSEVENLAQRILPTSITANFSGTAQAFQQSQQGLGVLLLITVFIIYIILGILYESFIHPITILTGLPFAAFGALLALFVTGQQLDVYGYVGVVMLIGIVKKNAIMMIDFAIERERAEHISPAAAIAEAASVRLRPIMTTLVMIAILFFGIVAYRQLPVSDLPNVDFPTLTVTAVLPGASPTTMAATVATPLEKQFSTIAGIDNMTSTSSLGQTQIVIQFSLDRNIDAAAQDVQAAITQTLRGLPQGILPPSYQKANPASAPIITLALTSDQGPLSHVDEYAQTTIAQRLSTVAGVAQVLVYGAQKYAVRVQLDPSQLATRNLALEDVATAITSQNVNLPTGVLNGPRTALTVQASGQLQSAAEFRDLVVAYRNGAPVHLSEIGRVADDVQNNKTASWYGTSRSIVLAIQRQPGTNTVAVAQRVKDALAKVQGDIPPNVKVSVLYDRSLTIQESVRDVTFTLELTLVLVVLVIFLFLRNLSATIIPSLALPMSIIGTFSVMYLLHYSLDNLSLMALTLAVGFVVDDPIVMLENIVRTIERGNPRMQAALAGAEEVGFTIVSMTFSLAAVFIPVLFMGGIIGKLFHEFAVTIGVAILVSGFVSLSLTPMLSSRFLRSTHGKAQGRFYQVTERIYDRWLAAYARSLDWVMARRLAALIFSVITLALTAALFMIAPKGLFPIDDTGQLLAITEAAEGVSFSALIEAQQQ